MAVLEIIKIKKNKFFCETRNAMKEIIIYNSKKVMEFLRCEFVLNNIDKIWFRICLIWFYILIIFKTIQYIIHSKFFLFLNFKFPFVSMMNIEHIYAHKFQIFINLYLIQLYVWILLVSSSKILQNLNLLSYSWLKLLVHICKFEKNWNINIILNKNLNNVHMKVYTIWNLVRIELFIISRDIYF